MRPGAGHITDREAGRNQRRRSRSRRKSGSVGSWRPRRTIVPDGTRSATGAGNSKAVNRTDTQSGKGFDGTGTGVDFGSAARFDTGSRQHSALQQRMDRAEQQEPAAPAPAAGAEPSQSIPRTDPAAGNTGNNNRTRPRRPATSRCTMRLMGSRKEG